MLNFWISDILNLKLNKKGKLVDKTVTQNYRTLSDSTDGSRLQFLTYKVCAHIGLVR